MKVTKIEPRTLTWYVEAEKGDEECYLCSWVKFTLDLDSYRLSVVGDGGDYTYAWYPTPDTESFVKLMSKVGEEYLLNKLSSRTKFLFLESLNDTLDNLDYKIDDEEIEKIKKFLICTCNEYEFVEELQTFVDCLDYEDICIVKDYPSGAKASVGLFIKYIQPILKDMAKEEKV